MWACKPCFDLNFYPSKLIIRSSPWLKWEGFAKEEPIGSIPPEYSTLRKQCVPLVLCCSYIYLLLQNLFDSLQKISTEKSDGSAETARLPQLCATRLMFSSVFVGGLFPSLTSFVTVNVFVSYKVLIYGWIETRRCKISVSPSKIKYMIAHLTSACLR